MTVEELIAALKLIIDEAEGRDLSEDEIERYEKLEVELKAKQKDVEIRNRQAAYETPARMDLVVHTAEKPDDTLERAFDSYLRTGRENQDLVELRAQSTLTGAAGGFTVPEVFRQKLTDRLLSYGGLATVVEVLSTSGGEDMRWPTLDDTANQGVIAAEGAAGAGGADLVFGETVLGAFKYVAPGATSLPLRVSLELLQDSAFDISGLVARKLGERIGRTQAVDWVNGVGTTEPFGITTGAGPTSIVPVIPTYNALVAAIHDVDPDYRTSARWVFSDTMLQAVRQVVDTAGRPLWDGQAQSGMGTLPGGMLLGYPVVIDQAFAVPALNAEVGVFGDVREGYVIRRVQDVTLIVNPFSRANEGQVEYVVWARADGVPQNRNAYTILTNPAV